jgi:excisionase family DNA binding protein
MTTEFLTTLDVARILGMNKRVVMLWCKNGKLPAIKLSRWRISKGELQRWMDEKGLRRNIDYVF